MKIKNPFHDLTGFEMALWGISVVIVSLSFLVPIHKDYLTLLASLIGVTALIFVAKGYVLGQILTVAFAVFYGIISVAFRYYGEMITYLGMTTPMAVLAVISWVRHPFENTKEVEVHRMTKRQIWRMLALALVTTVVFFFILKAFDTMNLIPSTISVTTSFLACYMTFMRSPYYALGYAANDIVLIVLWVLAARTDLSCLPMVICFVMFFFNDVYGFLNWKRMQKRQCGDVQQMS